MPADGITQGQAERFINLTASARAVRLHSFCDSNRTSASNYGVVDVSPYQITTPEGMGTTLKISEKIKVCALRRFHRRFHLSYKN